MPTASTIFNKLVEMAAKTPRNIILDQTNVIVNDEDTLAERTAKREREEGKFVPVEAVNDMRANFVAPDLDDGFTEIEFPELPEKEARELIGKIKHHGMAWQRKNPWGGTG